MDLHEYLEQVTGQMRCKKARDMVAEELKNHIEDQAESYEEFGLGKEEAQLRAVEQMGDPIEVGTSMDRIHRPKIDVRLILFIVMFTVLGVALQMLKQQSETTVNDAAQWIGGRPGLLSVCANAGIGLLVMFAVMFLDYSIFGKHPKLVWCGLLLLLLISAGFGITFYSFDGALQMSFSNTNINILNAVLILSFAALVYDYRNKGYKGILLCLFWLFVASILCTRIQGVSLAAGISFFAAGTLVISFAVQKEWFRVKKGKGQLLLWGSWLIPAILLLAGILTGVIGRSYQTARIRYFFDPQMAAQGGGYVTLTMRERLAGLHFLGGSLSEGEANWWYSFNYVLEKYGIAVGIILVAALALLFGRMLAGILHQKNRLGSLLGISCISYLVITTLLHILTALTLVPATSAFLPFLDMDSRNAVISSYLLLGVYLSVYRNTNILPEKWNEPAKRVRILVERVEKG